MICVFLIVFCFGALPSYPMPQKVDLPVPFLCQAPYGNWSEPWQDACEEAAIIMAMHYLKGSQVDRRSGNQEILSLVEYQEEHYGGHFDLTAAKTSKLVKDYYHYVQADVRHEFTVSDIKEELVKGNVVIAPMAGRLLHNPYYTPPGPAYHYMVFKGYDDSTGVFITNDSGTRRGRDYRYKYQTIFNAIHDWTGSKATINKGRKAIIVFKTS